MMVVPLTHFRRPILQGGNPGQVGDADDGGTQTLPLVPHSTSTPKVPVPPEHPMYPIVPHTERPAQRRAPGAVESAPEAYPLTGTVRTRWHTGTVQDARCRCGRGEPSPGADVARASPVPVQMWQGRARSRCRCGRGEPGPGADVAGASRPTEAPLRLGARTVQECARRVHRRV